MRSIEVFRAGQEVTATRAPADLAALLGTATGSLLVRIRRVTPAADGSTIGFAISATVPELPRALRLERPR